MLIVCMFTGHRSPICDLCANDTFLVSGDGHGSIVIWNVTNNEAKSTTYIEGYGYINMFCSEMLFTEFLFIVSYIGFDMQAMFYIQCSVRFTR